MSNLISEDCSSGLHDYCTPCQCKCHWSNSLFPDKPIYGKHFTAIHPEAWSSPNLQRLDIWANDISDGYHTFSQLYEHRYALFCALTRIYDNYITPIGHSVKCWKSKLHSDGTMFEDSFIVGMTVKQIDTSVQQITYHLPMNWWDKFRLIELDHAPEYDGHTSDDVIQRLLKL